MARSPGQTLRHASSSVSESAILGIMRINSGLQREWGRGVEEGETGGE